MTDLARCHYCDAHAGVATLISPPAANGEWVCANTGACQFRQVALIYDMGTFYLRDDEYPAETP